MNTILNTLRSMGILSAHEKVPINDKVAPFDENEKPHVDYFNDATHETSEERIIELADASLRDDFRLALVTFFHGRDCRGGFGMRKPFIISMSRVPAQVRKILYPLIPHYGYWDDLNKLAIFVPKDRKFIAKFFAIRLRENMQFFSKELYRQADRNFEKWLPTEGQADDKEWGAVGKIIIKFNDEMTKNPETIYLKGPSISAVIDSVKGYFKEINPDTGITYSENHLMISCDTDGFVTRKYLHILKKAYALPEEITMLDRQTYRKWCSFARAFFDVTEHYKSTKNWDMINYQMVPSISFRRSKEQFETHDPERFSSFKHLYPDENIQSLMPYELMSDFLSDEQDKRWKQIIEDVKLFYKYIDVNNIFHPINSIQIADIDKESDSDSQIHPIDIALSLALLRSEVGGRSMYAFSNEIYKFDVNWKTLSEAKRNINDAHCRHDLKAIINFICDELTKESRDTIPKSIFIYTDRDFEDACGMSQKDAILYIRDRFSEFGETPIVIFWEIQNDEEDIIITTSDNFIYVEGFSVDLYTTFMEIADTEDLSPKSLFYKAVLNNRYLPILKTYEDWRGKNSHILDAKYNLDG